MGPAGRKNGEAGRKTVDILPEGPMFKKTFRINIYGAAGLTGA
jgi:hypothetical protein